MHHSNHVDGITTHVNSYYESVVPFRSQKGLRDSMKIVVAEFRHDPVSLDASEVITEIREWVSSDCNEWLESNAVGPLYVENMFDVRSYTYRIAIIAELSSVRMTEFLLKYK